MFKYTLLKALLLNYSGATLLVFLFSHDIPCDLAISDWLLI